MGRPTRTTWPQGYDLASNLGITFPPLKPSGSPSNIATTEVNIAAAAPTASPAAVQLIAAMCSWNPADRPSAEQALKHPFFQVGFIRCKLAE